MANTTVLSSDRLIREETRFQGGYGRTVLETLRYAYRPFRGRILAYASLGFIGRLALLGNANLVGKWVDSFCVGPTCKPVPTFMADWTAETYITVLGFLVAGGFLCTLLFRIRFSQLSARAVSRLYDETTFRTSRLPMAYFDHTPVGRLVTRFSSDYGNVFRLFGGPFAEFISIIFDLVCMITLALVASPLFAPLIVFVVVCNWFVFRANQKKMRACRRELSASRSPAIAHFAETAQGASTIRSFNKTRVFEERFRGLDEYCLDQKRSTVRAILGFSIQMNSLSALLVGGAGLLAWFAIADGRLSVGDTGVFFSFTALAGVTVQNFFEWLSQVEEALVGVERMDHLLRQPLEIGGKLPPAAEFPTGHPRAATPEPLVRGGERALAVRFDDVWFRYSDKLPWVLKGLRFSIPAGQKIGVIGRTGSGKSSLIQALFYLYAIDKGVITVGGRYPDALEERAGAGDRVELTAYRRMLSLISQDTAIFRGTIRENLDVTGTAPDAEMISALEKVGLDFWANPAGLDAPVEERGRNLSAGEKQLLCIARCLLQDAPVVVMDEATSSIDPKSEELVMRASEKFFAGRTQIIIAHRLSTIEKCDQLIWIEQGTIRMMAPPSETLAALKDAGVPDASVKVGMDIKPPNEVPS